MSQSSKKLTNYSSPFQSHFNKSSSHFLTFHPNSRWTKQSFKDGCDINTIMARYMSTGEMPDISTRAPQYMDASGFDFQLMQDQVVEAKRLFMELPSVLRSRFANDPAEFIAYCQDEENRSEMIKLGLISKTTSDAIPQRSEDSAADGKRSAADPQA